MADFQETTKGIFLNNWALKALALLLALITYQSIREAISFEIPYEIPVEVKVEKGIAVLDQNPHTVQVTFQGSREDIRQLTHGQMKVVLTPKATNPDGSEVMTITQGNIHGASGVRVVHITPDTVSLTFDRESEKKISVNKPKIHGAPLAGKVELDYEPKVVTIKGPKRRLDGKNFLDTEPVDVDGRVQSFTKRVKILPPADAMLTKIEPAEVEVKVSIATDTVTRGWTNVTVTAMTAPATSFSITIDPPIVDVQLHGRKDLIEGIKDKSLSTFVDCTALKPGASEEMPVRVYMPFGPNLTATALPEKVKVTASKLPPKPEAESE